MKPKRFLVFVFSTYYPSGGWEDLAAGFDTEEEAKKAVDEAVNPTSDDNGHVVDLETGKIVYEKHEHY